MRVFLPNCGISKKHLSRFFKKIEKTDDCWIWTAGKDRAGYGLAWFINKLWKAHRLSYLVANGSIDNDLMVMHRCDNPPCVNPDHLKQGTAKQNSADMYKKKRNRPAKPLTSADILTIRSLKGIKEASLLAWVYNIPEPRIHSIFESRI